MAKFLVWLAQLGIGLLAHLRSSKDKELGKLEERNEHLNEAMDDVTKANAVETHIKSDSTKRKRVQKRFTRK